MLDCSCRGALRARSSINIAKPLDAREAMLQLIRYITTLITPCIYRGSGHRLHVVVHARCLGHATIHSKQTPVRKARTRKDIIQGLGHPVGARGAQHSGNCQKHTGPHQKFAPAHANKQRPGAVGRYKSRYQHHMRLHAAAERLRHDVVPILCIAPAAFTPALHAQQGELHATKPGQGLQNGLSSIVSSGEL